MRLIFTVCFGVERSKALEEKRAIMAQRRFFMAWERLVMRKTTQTITILLFFTPISAGTNYTLFSSLISRFKSLRNVSNITIVLPDFPSICFNIHSELKREYLLFHINFKTINKALKEFSWKLISSY